MRIALRVLAAVVFCVVPLTSACSGGDATATPKSAPANPSGAPANQDVVKKNFNAMDKDGDGLLTLNEFNGNRKAPAAIEKGKKMFKLIDADGDGKATLQEFAGRPAEARFIQMDQDDDGKLTWDEFKGTRKPEELEQAERNFKRMDTNGDKSLSLAEFNAGQIKPVKPAAKEPGKVQPEPVKPPVKK